MAYQMLEMQNSKQAMEIGNTQTNLEVNGSVLNQDFFQDDNTIQKKQKRKISTKKPRKVKTPYSPTKIKARNYLSNISYSRICEEDFKNLSFIADALSFITMDLKHFF